MMMRLGLAPRRRAHTPSRPPIAGHPHASTLTSIDPAAARPPAMGAFREAYAVAFQAHEPFPQPQRGWMVSRTTPSLFRVTPLPPSSPAPALPWRCARPPSRSSHHLRDRVPLGRARTLDEVPRISTSSLPPPSTLPPTVRTLHAASSAPCWHTGWTAPRCAAPHEKAPWHAARLACKKFTYLSFSSFFHLEHPHEDFWRMSGDTTSPPPRAQSVHFSRYSSLASISTRRAESSIDVVPACFEFLRPLLCPSRPYSFLHLRIFGSAHRTRDMDSVPVVLLWLTLSPSAYCVWQAFS
ncbi:hypothetical protein B0H14DRAFT_3507166 [Mycena olivaceomarginata]|nr:hypothetical protein B0H14DRAFT_3507166 [Mycena olivaceomarginata]